MADKLIKELDTGVITDNTLAWIPFQNTADAGAKKISAFNFLKANASFPVLNYTTNGTASGFCNFSSGGTTLDFSETDADGNSVGLLLAEIKTGSYILAQDINDYTSYTIHLTTANAVDNGTYQSVSVSPISTQFSFASSKNLHISFILKGPVGLTGATGATGAIGPGVGVADGSYGSTVVSQITISSGQITDIQAS